MTYDCDPTRTATVQFTPRQWTRLLLDGRTMLPATDSQVSFMLAISEHYPGMNIAIDTTPREASFIAAMIRDYQERGY